MKSVMSHTFSKVPSVDIPRSVFNRSAGYKTTLQSDYLVPFYFDEVMPGDSFKVDTTCLLRFNDLLRPFMDTLFIDTFYFFVPYRLVWENWVRMCGEQTNPGDSTDYMVPQLVVKAEDRMPMTIFDYFGVPQAGQSYLARGYRLSGSYQDGVFTPSKFIKISDGSEIDYNSQLGSELREETLSFNSLWFRAYNLIWNEWFRDENLQDSVVVELGDGPDVPEEYTLLKRGKRHDYFTSCLPWPQKGPQVRLPLGSSAPVFSRQLDTVSVDTLTPMKLYDRNGNTLRGGTTSAGVLGFPNYQSTVLQHGYGTVNGGYLALNTGSGTVNQSLYTDLSDATASTINQIREAFAIQRMYEKDARGGTRYTEILQNHFKVFNPDLRLQRPEFLGHSSERVNVITVPQTSSSTSESKQGNLAAYSLTGIDNGFAHSFGEFGVVIGLISIRADLTYQQGLDRILSKRTRFDYYWPGLAHLGEQAVLNKEIFAGTSEDDDVFGYQERYAEYRYKKSLITGYLNSLSPLPLDQWHLSQKFENLPTLSADFIQEKVPLDRVVAITDQPPFLLDVYTSIKAARPMPVFGVPGLIDHF